MTRDEEAAHDFEYGPIPSDIEAMMRAAGFSHSDGYEEWGHVQGSHGALRRLVAAVAAAEPIKPEALPLADAPECTTAIIVEQCMCGLLAVGYAADLKAEIERLRADAEKWKNEAMLMGAHQGIDNHQRLLDRAEKAEAECNALRVSSDARIFAETYTRLDAQAAKLIAEVEKLRADAERYRHLCEYQRWTPEIEAAFDCSPKVLIDEAIDNSIKAMKELTK
jgi:limonene-1,2-epoxide hydrolase